MTLVEYELRMEAYQLKQVDRQNEIAQQAWMNQQVQATTGIKNPKPKFKKFDDFFDKKVIIDKVLLITCDQIMSPITKCHR